MNQRVLKVLGYFLLLVGSIFLGTILIAVLKIHWAFKVLIGIIAILLSVLSFIGLEKTNKQVKPQEKVQKASDLQIGHLRCPKCHKPYDGETCFNCGYQNKKEIGDNNESGENNEEDA